MLKTSEIKRLIEDCKTLNELEHLKNEITKTDERKIVQNMFFKHEKFLIKLEELNKEYEYRLKHEKELYPYYDYIAGVDEVGRGPLAGPVYAAVVILNKEKKILGIKDSKKLTEKAREKLYEEIKLNAIDYAIGIATVEEIDELNILNATKLAMIRAIKNLNIKPDYLLLDAIKLDLEIPQTSIIHGDDLSVSIGAASILAKVERDKFMNEISERYPQYWFNENKGYGTKQHIEAIKKFGPCILHRKTFIKNL